MTVLWVPASVQLKMFRLLWLFEEGNDISCWPKKLMKKPNRAKAYALAQIRNYGILMKNYQVSCSNKSIRAVTSPMVI